MKMEAKELLDRNFRFSSHLRTGMKLKDIPKKDLVWEWEVIKYGKEIQEYLDGSREPKEGTS